MNTSQTTSLQESKCTCIKNFFSKILNKKTPKKNKKTDSEINSELNYILTKTSILNCHFLKFLIIFEFVYYKINQ